MVMSITTYLKENIDERVTITPWPEKGLFPVLLRNQYNFYEMTILKRQCILMEVLEPGPGIDALQKHRKQIKVLTNLPVVLFYKEMTRYRRKSLIENRISFVIEDGQMYLPFLGLDLKKAPEQVGKEVKQFTTSAQLAYLYFLYHANEVVNMTEFADKMGFTKMTASRALNDLYHAKLITYTVGGKTGRSKEYKRIPDPEYFTKGRNYLKSPVRKTVYTKTVPKDALSAGLEALAELSMINPPDHPVRAIGEEEYKKQGIQIIKNRDLIKDAKLVELQLWEYDPKQFSDGNHVDLLSLYASLKEETDERIEQALGKALRDKPWYLD